MTFISDRRSLLRTSALFAAAIPALPLSASETQTPSSTSEKTPPALFNVKDYGATGLRAGNAQPAIQRTIEACSAAGGGVVYLPPGEYTSGTIYLRSHVRFFLEAGATLYASQNVEDFNQKPRPDKASLIFGEKLENVSLEGRGTIDGLAEYDWRDDDIEDIFVKPAKDRMKAMGKSIQRSFPKGYPGRTVFPHLVWMGECTNVQISGLSFVRSQSWTMAFFQCNRLTVDSVYVFTKANDAVWADGIDLDGCQDVCIANSTIRTGDDCIAIFSGGFWGTPRVAEDITVSNCRFSSCSNAVKFTEGNIAGVRRVTISNCVISENSSGFGFLCADGGFIEDVIIANCTLNLRRFGWFWGQGGPFGFVLKRREEWAGNQPLKKGGGPSPGSIRNIVLRDLTIHAVGRAHVNGHPDSLLDGVTFENIRLFLRTDPDAPFDQSIYAIEFRWAKNLKLRNIEIHWDEPKLDAWKSALYLQDIEGLEIDGFRGRQAWPDRDVAAIVFEDVKDVMIRDSAPAEGTGTFLEVLGETSGEIVLFGNDFRKAKVPYRLGSGVKKNAVLAVNNIGPTH